MAQSKIDDAKRKYNERLINELLERNGISGSIVLSYLNFAKEIEGKRVQTNEDAEKVIKKWEERG